MTRKALVALCTLAGIALAAVSVLSFAGCGDQAPTASQATDVPASRVPVETTRPVRQKIQRVSETTPAILLPQEQTDLHARLTGFIKEIRVDYGDRVTKGEILAVLWVPEMEKELEQKEAHVTLAKAAIEQAKATLKAAEAGIKSAEAGVTEAEASRGRASAQYELWKDEYARIKDLVIRKVMTQQNLDVTLNQYRAAQASLTEVEAKIQSAKAALEESKARKDKAGADVKAAEATLLVTEADRDQARDMLQYAKVVAPYNGVVTKRNLHTGAFINPKAGDQPLLTVVRTNFLRVVVDVSERDVRYLNKDAKVAATFDALPGKRFEWKITRRAPVLGSGKRVRVEVDEIPNPDGTLYPGMYGYASVILEEKLQALTVPAACLGSDDKGAFVWLAVEGKAERRRVTVGINDGTRAELTLGLSGTEEVICSGKEALRDGQPVMIQRPTR
jgi:RND family efflux transporter MFP subunit